ncbi:MAG: hypothetical protein NTU76_01130 [Candidatus Taylorbacteria bacterium]|nr:hypothetical protein [Candidatus Taylorbacteria bacterium]
MQEENTNYTPPVYQVGKPKKAISTFLGIAIIVLVAIVLFGGVFAWQYFTTKVKFCCGTENQTAGSVPSEVEGWKTYTNTQYGFEFKYPNGWSVEESTWTGGSDKNAIIFMNNNFKPASSGDFQARIDIGGPLDADIWANYLKNKEGSIVSVTKVNVAGIDMVRAEFNPTQAGPYAVYEFTRNGINYSMSTNYVIPRDYVADKILFTFKFITPNQTASLLASPTSGAAPLVVQFNKNLVGCASNLSIDYGDGTSCTTANPDGSEKCSVFTHTYQNPGEYNVKVHCFMSNETTDIITIKVAAK